MHQDLAVMWTLQDIFANFLFSYPYIIFPGTLSTIPLLLTLRQVDDPRKASYDLLTFTAQQTTW